MSMRDGCFLKNSKISSRICTIKSDKYEIRYPKQHDSNGSNISTVKISRYHIFTFTPCKHISCVTLFVLCNISSALPQMTSLFCPQTTDRHNHWIQLQNQHIKTALETKNMASKYKIYKFLSPTLNKTRKMFEQSSQ